MNVKIVFLAMSLLLTSIAQAMITEGDYVEFIGDDSAKYETKKHVYSFVNLKENTVLRNSKGRLSNGVIEKWYKVLQLNGENGGSTYGYLKGQSCFGGLEVIELCRYLRGTIQTITVPAGKFKTCYIEYHNKDHPGEKYETWYGAVLGSVVQSRAPKDGTYQLKKYFAKDKSHCDTH